MKFSLKTIRKILSLNLALLLFFNSAAIPLAYAQEDGTEPTPTEFISPVPTQTPVPDDQVSPSLTSEPTGTPSPTVTLIPDSVTPSDPTPTAEPVTPALTLTPTPQSTINTGDAGSSTTTDITANQNTDNLSGGLSVSDGSCPAVEAQTSCPGDINIGNGNSASSSSTVTSSASTGGNQITGSSGDAAISSGNATASGQVNKSINQNTTDLSQSPTPVPSETPLPSPTGPAENSSAGEDNSSDSTSVLAQDPTSLTGSTQPAPILIPSPTPDVQQLVVENQNEAKIENQADVSAETGENQANANLGDAQIQTGDAQAWLNLINFLNTNIVGSNFELMFLDVKDTSQSEINLNDLWKEIENKAGADSLHLLGDENSSNLQLFIFDENSADLENKVNVSADTGQNQANGNNNAEVGTGQATALANVTNVVNTNLLGSKFFFGVINLLGGFNGNIILPRPERFSSDGQDLGENSQTQPVIANQNNAQLEDNVNANANTGGNQADNNQGSTLTQTGNATAAANSLSIVNLNLHGSSWFFLSLSSLGVWEGKIYGWSQADSVEEQREVHQTYQVNPESNLTQDQDSGAGEPDPSTTFLNDNTASVKNDINVTATTGGNQANDNRGGTQIETGDARAAANLVNLVNLNIIGGRWFLGLINVLGRWTGNVVFASPDLSIGLESDRNGIFPGETFNYLVDYHNVGYDDAEEATIKFQFPLAVQYLDDESGRPSSCAQDICSWNLGLVKRDGGGSFKIRVRLAPDFSFDQKVSFWDFLVPKVYAAENQAMILAKAWIETSDPESDTTNNTALLSNEVNPIPRGGVTDQINDEIDQRQPVLEITAKNNVNDFVYFGDTVTFEITVENKGKVPAYDCQLIQDIYDGIPGGLGRAVLDLGTIEPSEGGTITFGVRLDNDLFQTEHYYTVATVEGYAPNDNKVVSNQAKTEFDMKFKNRSFPPAVAGKEEDRILGVNSFSCDQKEKIWPYIILLLLSSGWLVEKTARMLKSRQEANAN